MSVTQKIRRYTEAIRLKPDYTVAFYKRGVVQRAKGDLDGAGADFKQAERLNA